ncbi:MAG: dihydrolipoyl dehydrogenase [Candidatus Uhrbacteria bacterium]|nr:dihydrolipoyl dehydrogenase [Candidatus Uhrbacteria bacterium]
MLAGRKKIKTKVKFDYDVIVIGSGSAGFSSAEVARDLGASVCIVEKAEVGGECPNWACVPTKAMLRSAKLYYQARYKLSEYGVHADGVTFNFSKIMQRKDNVIDTITGTGKKLDRIAKELGIDVVKGEAIFLDAHTLKIAKKKISGKSIIIATGSVDFVPPIDGIEQVGYLSFKDVVSLKRLPGSVAIAGGGPVGCEFATFFSMLGSKVTILQLAPQLLNHEDEEVSAVVERMMRERRVNVLVNTKVLGVLKEGRKTRVTYQTGTNKRQSVAVDAFILSVGKRANVEDLKLEKAGVKLSDNGRLVVDEHLQTNIPNIFAAGDVSSSAMFTNVAHFEGSIAGYNAMQKRTQSMRNIDIRVVPRVTFVEPEVASVGITPLEASKSKKAFSVSSFPVGALGRAVTEGERIGLIKIVIDKKTRMILGGHMVGPQAGEVIHEIALAMHANLKVDELESMIHAFPTYSEAVSAVAGGF